MRGGGVSYRDTEPKKKHRVHTDINDFDDSDTGSQLTKPHSQPAEFFPQPTELFPRSTILLSQPVVSFSQPAAEQQHPQPAAEQQHPQPAAEQQHPQPAAEQQHPQPAAEQQYPQPAAEQRYPQPAAEQHSQPTLLFPQLSVSNLTHEEITHQITQRNEDGLVISLNRGALVYCEPPKMTPIIFCATTITSSGVLVEMLSNSNQISYLAVKQSKYPVHIFENFEVTVQGHSITPASNFSKFSSAPPSSALSASSEQEHFGEREHLGETLLNQCLGTVFHGDHMVMALPQKFSSSGCFNTSTIHINNSGVLFCRKNSQDPLTSCESWFFENHHLPIKINPNHEIQIGPENRTVDMRMFMIYPLGFSRSIGYQNPLQHAVNQ